MRKPALLKRWAVFSVCPIPGFFRSRGLGCCCTLNEGIGSLREEGGTRDLGCCCTSIEGVSSLREDRGVMNRTRGLGFRTSLRAGFFTTGVWLRLDFSGIDPVAVGLCSFRAPANCVFDGKLPVPDCFFAMAAHLSILLMAFLAPGSSSRDEAKPNPLGVPLLRLTVASKEFCSCVPALLLPIPSYILRKSGLPLVLVLAWKY